MVRVGLTGGIASGKTTVANEFAKRGALLIDADLLARDVVAPGTAGLAAIAARFGPTILDAHGALNRQALGALVFSDAAARADLNAIVHPLVLARAHEVEAQNQDFDIIVHVIPLLVETHQEHDFDEVVVVDIDPAVQCARLMERNQLTREQAQARIAAQASRQQRLDAATIVINNNADRAGLLAEIERAWSLIEHRYLDTQFLGGEQ
ncbi:MAG: dephospho-CoA kinase [Propionibacteriaceae bacterium]